MKKLSILAIVLSVTVGIACGSDDNGEEFPNASPGNLDIRHIDWVVDGMQCNGEEMIRLMSLEDAEDDGESEPQAQYRRGDDCVDAGQRFWQSWPESDGDTVSIVVDSETGDERSFEVQSDGEYAMDLMADDGGDDLRMRQANPESNPTPIPDLSDFDLAGEWWMEGYPCGEHLVPQVVRIIHPGGGDVHMTKIVGDDCVGDGENFLDAEVNGTSISGEAQLEESDDFGGLSEDDNGDDIDWSQASGTVHNEDYIRLDVAGQAVTLRRVMAE